jgi:hypothetical protein
MNTDVLQKTLYDSLKQTFTDKVTPSTIIKLVTVVIALIQKQASGSLTPDEKKQMAMNLIKSFITDSKDITDEDKLYLNQLVELTVPSTIDILIKVAKQEIDIGKSMKDTGSCFCC